MSYANTLGNFGRSLKSPGVRRSLAGGGFEFRHAPVRRSHPLKVHYVIAVYLTIVFAGSPMWAQHSLPGIGDQQAQCWARYEDLTPWEREAPLSELLLEKTNGQCHPVKTNEEWEKKKARIRESWGLLLGQFPQSVPPLKARILWEEKKSGYILEKISYDSEPDDTVSAYLLVPEKLDRPAPAVVACMPTTPYGKEAMVGLAENAGYWYPLELVQRGYVVLAPEVLTTGERISPGLEPFDTSGFCRTHRHWSMLGKMLWDHQRGVDYLLTLDFVDRKRIGAMGWSLGAHNACFLAAFDPRIAAVVTDGGVMHFSGNPNPFDWCRDPEFPTRRDGRVGKFAYLPRLKPYLLAGETPTDLHELQALIAPRPYLDMNSVGDNWRSGLVASLKLRRLYAFLGAADQFEYFVFDGNHAFPPQMQAKACEWMDRYLRLGTDSKNPLEHGEKRQ